MSTLKKLREESGKTLAEVANALNVCVRAVSRYEQGTRTIGLEQVLRLSQLYDVTTGDIINAQLNSCRKVPINSPQ